MSTLELVENALFNIETVQKILSHAGAEQMVLAVAVAQLKTVIVQLEGE